MSVGLPADQILGALPKSKTCAVCRKEMPDNRFVICASCEAGNTAPPAPVERVVKRDAACTADYHQHCTRPNSCACECHKPAPIPTPPPCPSCAHAWHDGPCDYYRQDVDHLRCCCESSERRIRAERRADDIIRLGEFAELQGRVDRLAAHAAALRRAAATAIVVLDGLDLEETELSITAASQLRSALEAFCEASPPES